MKQEQIKKPSEFKYAMTQILYIVIMVYAMIAFVALNSWIILKIINQQTEQK